MGAPCKRGDTHTFRRDAIFLCAQFGCELCAEIFGLENLPDLDFGFSRVRIRAALEPVNCFLEGIQLPNPEARNEFLGFREWAIDHRALFT